jgi:hypothetical protein
MELHVFPRKSVLRKVLLTAAALGALVVAGAPRAQAKDGQQCRYRISQAEWRLQEAIEHHGYYSRQAHHERYELQQQREQCWRERRRWREQEWRERHEYNYGHGQDRD